MQWENILLYELVSHQCHPRVQKYSGSRCNAVRLINPQHLRNWES